MAEYHATASPCDGFIAEILQYFHAKVPSGLTVTDDALHHVERTAPYAICYAFETGSGSDPNWWNDTGREYWQSRIDQLFADHLPRSGTVDGVAMKNAMLELADSVGGRFVRLLEMLEAREVMRRARRDVEPVDPPDALEQVRSILGMCPFMRMRQFTL